MFVMTKTCSNRITNVEQCVNACVVIMNRSILLPFTLTDFVLVFIEGHLGAC